MLRSPQDEAFPAFPSFAYERSKVQGLDDRERVSRDIVPVVL